MPNSLIVWITANWKILKKDGNARSSYLPPEKSVFGQEETELDMEQQTGSKVGKVSLHPNSQEGQY